MRTALAFVLVIAGCAKPTAGVIKDGGAHDLANGGGQDSSTTDDGPPPPDFSGVDLRGANFAGADFAGADFSTTGDMGQCVLFPQSGCGSGEKCEPGSSGNTCAANGNKTTGQGCGTGGTDDCVAGDLCSSDSASGTFVCRAFCAADSDCKQAAVPVGGTSEPKNIAYCLVTFMNTTAKACTVACNPVTKAGATGCPTGLACIYGGTATIPELTDCATPGAGADGATCTDTTNCAAGFVCVGAAGGTAHCRQVCRNATPGDCNGAGYLCDAPNGVTNPMFGFCCPGAGC